MKGEISKKDYDVLIVGAGPAGCSAAFFLSCEGFEVLLLDKSRFPRDKICGDGMSPSTIEMLDKIGVAEKIEEKRPWKTYSLIVSSPSGIVMRSKYPYVEGLRDYGYIFPRKDLDALLYEHIKALPNIDVLEEFKVTDIIYEKNRIYGIKGEYENRIEEVRGRFIIGADGVHSVIAKKLSLFNSYARYRAFAVRAYFNHVEGLSDSIEIHYDEDFLPGYGWIFPTAEGSANVGVGIICRYKEFKDIRRLFEIFIEKNRFAKEKMKDARMVENSFKGWPLTLGAFPSKRCIDNVLLVGDAGSFIDPLTGEGIYYALRSGEYAARSITSGLKKDSHNSSIGQRYEKLWRKEFRWKEFMPGHMMQLILNKKFLIDCVIKRASKNRKKAFILTGAIIHKMPKRRLLLNM